MENKMKPSQPRGMKAHEYAHLYNTYRWRKIRAQHIKENPLCVMCLEDGRAIPGNVCDHVTPHKGDVVKFYNGPFQTLCKRHHDSTKARQESKGVMPGCNADGLPIDANHPWNLPES